MISCKSRYISGIITPLVCKYVRGGGGGGGGHVFCAFVCVNLFYVMFVERSYVCGKELIAIIKTCLMDSICVL